MVLVTPAGSLERPADSISPSEIGSIEGRGGSRAGSCGESLHGIGPAERLPGRRRVFKQCGCPGVPFSEASGHTVLDIRLPGDGLVQHAHEPGEIHEPLAVGGDPKIDPRELGRAQVFRVCPIGRATSCRTQWVSRSAVSTIESAEICASDTTRNDVVPGSGVEGDEGGAGLGHAGLLPWNLCCEKANAAPPSVQAMWVSRRSSSMGVNPSEYPNSTRSGPRVSN